jgi:hypothetical protein
MFNSIYMTFQKWQSKGQKVNQSSAVYNGQGMGKADNDKRSVSEFGRIRQLFYISTVEHFSKCKKNDC